MDIFLVKKVMNAWKKRKALYFIEYKEWVNQNEYTTTFFRNTVKSIYMFNTFRTF